MIRFKCCVCARRLRSRAGTSGKAFACPSCSAKQVVPIDPSVQEKLNRELDHYRPQSDVVRPENSAPGHSETKPSTKERNHRKASDGNNAKPDQVQSEHALRLYDLLRDEPVFVAWYMSTFENDMYRWRKKQMPINAFWSRWGVSLVVSWGIALTGIGLLLTLAVNAFILFRFYGDQTRYAAWRNQVDSLINILGLTDGLKLMKRAPKVDGFRQFFNYVVEIGRAGSMGYKAGHR